MVEDIQFCLFSDLASCALRRTEAALAEHSWHIRDALLHASPHNITIVSSSRIIMMTKFPSRTLKNCTRDHSSMCRSSSDCVNKLFASTLSPFPEPMHLEQHAEEREGGGDYWRSLVAWMRVRQATAPKKSQGDTRCISTAHMQVKKNS